MILADFGADVIHVLRPDASGPDPSAFLRRGKRELVVDLRSDAGPDVLARMADACDVLLEGNRPGAMERRGLGPDTLLARNPRLVYTRLTGWGQIGPYAGRAGHDINYLAVSGVLGAIGTDEPVVPLAFLGDLASGSFQAAFGTVLALFERERTGRGQVVDAAIVDGAALLLSAAFGERASGMWSGGRGTHVLSGVAPFYGVYQCADGRWFAVGAIEAPFYDAMLEILDIDHDRGLQWDTGHWPALRATVADVFRRHPRDHWTERFGGVDACGTPVLEIDELDTDPHLSARGTIASVDGRLTSAPAPRLSSHEVERHPQPAPDAPVDVLTALGFERSEVAALEAAGVVRRVVGR